MEEWTDCALVFSGGTSSTTLAVTVDCRRRRLLDSDRCSTLTLRTLTTEFASFQHRSLPR